MVKYLDELDKLLKKYGIEDDEIIIVGSAALTVIGGRENRDLDICFTEKGYKKLPLNIKIFLLRKIYYHFGDNIDINRYHYAKIGISDRKIYSNSNKHDKYNYIIPEIEIACKIKMNREKDIKDLEMIRNNNKISGIDWELVDELSKRHMTISNVGMFIYVREKLRKNWVALKKRIMK